MNEKISGEAVDNMLMEIENCLSKYWLYFDPKVRMGVVSETQCLVQKLRDELKKK